MNKVGVHALVWVGGWSEAECRRAIENSRATGYDLIEIPVLDPSAIDIAMTRKALDDAGLKAACSLGLSLNTDISSPDPEVVARDLGAEYLGGVISSALARYTRPPSVEGYKNRVRVLRSLRRQIDDTTHAVSSNGSKKWRNPDGAPHACRRRSFYQRNSQ